MNAPVRRVMPLFVVALSGCIPIVSAYYLPQAEGGTVESPGPCSADISRSLQLRIAPGVRVADGPSNIAPVTELPRIVKDDTQRMPLPPMQPADPVTQIRAVEAARGANGPMVDGEDDGVTLAQWHHIRPAGLLRIAFCQQQLAALKVASRFV
jgi:hypothetical protein